MAQNATVVSSSEATHYDYPIYIPDHGQYIILQIYTT